MFVFKELLQCPEERNIEIEQEMIDAFRKIMPGKIMNVFPTARLPRRTGIKHTEEVKKRISETSKKKRATEESKKKMSIAQKGRLFTEKMRETQLKVHLGSKASEETRKKMSESHKGQKRSEEAKERMRIAQRKRADSDEERNIRSERMKGNNIWLGRKHSEETKAKMSAWQKGKPKGKLLEETEQLCDTTLKHSDTRSYES